MAYPALFTLDAIRYARAKTRTTSNVVVAANPAGVPAGNPGPWPDEILTDYLNFSVRHIVSVLSVEYLAAYYGVILTEQVLVGNIYEIKEGAPADYGVLRPGWVKFAASSGDRAGRPIPEFTPSRIKYDQTYRSSRQGVSAGGEADNPEPYYQAFSMKDVAGTARRTVQLHFTNFPAGGIKIDLLHYRFPDPLDRTTPSAATEVVPIPPVCWNAFLDWACLKMLEDEGNPRASAIEVHYQREELAMVSAGVFNYDLPSGPPEKARAAMDVARSS